MNKVTGPARQSQQYFLHGYQVDLIGIGGLVDVKRPDDPEKWSGVILGAVVHMENVNPEGEEITIGYPDMHFSIRYTVLRTDEEGNDAGEEPEHVDHEYVTEV